MTPAEEVALRSRPDVVRLVLLASVHRAPTGDHDFAAAVEVRDRGGKRGTVSVQGRMAPGQEAERLCGAMAALWDAVREAASAHGPDDEGARVDLAGKLEES